MLFEPTAAYTVPLDATLLNCPNWIVGLTGLQTVAAVGTVAKFPALLASVTE